MTSAGVMRGDGAGRLHGKTAIITGATSGIGTAAACRFAAEGAQVVACGRDREAGARLLGSLGEARCELRPEEAIGLRLRDVMLPEMANDEERGSIAQWGELHLRAARPDVGSQWTDDGSGRDRRGLKHRAEGESRRVPCPPALTKLLHEHIADFGGEPADPLFRGMQGRPLATIT